MAEDQGTQAQDLAPEERVEVEKEAKLYGWEPKESFKGSPEDWVDAPEFVARGKQILPIVQSNNKRLLGQVNRLNSELLARDEKIRALDAAVRAIEDSQEETSQAQMEETRKRLKEELVAASRDGDHETVADLTEQLVNLGRPEKPARDDEEEGEEPQSRRRGEERRPPEIPVAMRQEILNWYNENPEYRTDIRRAALAQAVSTEFRAHGDLRKGAEFLDAVAEEVEKTLGGKPTGHPRVLGDGGGSGRRNRDGPTGQKTYADLPPDAKAACDRMAARLVGEGKKHKDLASWRKSYVSQYYAE